METPEFPRKSADGAFASGVNRLILHHPDWFLNNQPRPQQGRNGFVVWYHHRKDTPLLPSGLVGPVTLMPLSVSDR